MARSWYGAAPADFAADLGADADIVDEAGTPTGNQGSALLLPLTTRTFDVYTDAALTTVTTDLLDAAGTPITQVSSETDFAERGTIPRFQGPDGHEGPLWLSADGVTGYRMEPESGPLYTRVGTVETTQTSLVDKNLPQFSATVATDGQTLIWDNSLGEFAPGAAAGTGTVTSVASQPPDGSGNVALTPANIGAATAADMTVLKLRGYIGLAYTGSGYEPKPSGFTLAIRRGPQEPTSNLAVGDIWLQPQSSGS